MAAVQLTINLVNTLKTLVLQINHNQQYLPTLLSAVKQEDRAGYTRDAQDQWDPEVIAKRLMDPQYLILHPPSLVALYDFRHDQSKGSWEGNSTQAGPKHPDRLNIPSELSKDLVQLLVEAVPPGQRGLYPLSVGITSHSVASSQLSTINSSQESQGLIIQVISPLEEQAWSQLDSSALYYPLVAHAPLADFPSPNLHVISPPRSIFSKAEHEGHQTHVRHLLHTWKLVLGHWMGLDLTNPISAEQHITAFKGGENIDSTPLRNQEQMKIEDSDVIFLPVSTIFHSWIGLWLRLSN
ncbi:hypothetical protein FRB91_006919 [Serendipita sp. 411]|nr:hypothetical protein FRC15_003537 [Serendipita sp. 397]KAG8852160.1 hypothetical protein FRB91_006919 [Serendipita sp. 411]